MSESPLVQCSRCSRSHPADHFPFTVNGTRRLKTCPDCTAKVSAANAKARAARQAAPVVGDAPNASATSGGSTEDASLGTDGPSMSFTDFLALLLCETRKGPVNISRVVDISTVDFSALPAAGGRDGRKARAERLRECIQDCLGWRFSFHERVKNAPGPESDMYRFRCSQDQVNMKSNVDETSRTRDREYMTRFDCKSDLRITTHSSDQRHVARIWLRHAVHHEPYCDISLPPKVKEMITTHADLPIRDLWAKILSTFPDPQFTRKQVSTEWSRHGEKRWKRVEDPHESAVKLLEEFVTTAERIPIRDEPGMKVIAFKVCYSVQMLGAQVVEVALDGTFNTNSSNYEVSVLVGEANGQGIPLGFLLHVSTDGSASENAKERILDDFLAPFARACPNVRFTLSDKELGEIRALRRAFPRAKHTSCYWHGKRTIQTRLAADYPPGVYDPRLAQRVFVWIDPTWAPGVVGSDKDAEIDLKSGLVRVQRPEDVEEEMERAEQAIASVCRRPKFVVVAGDRRIPVWPAPPKVTKDDLPTFCPKEHREMIVERWCRAACLHPLIPFNDEDHSFLTADEIYEAATHDMYQYCREHDLSQVWAYMWNNWFCPDRWKLWARAAAPEVSVLRTTMVVEGFWNKLKHTTLGPFNRPRLDLAVFLIITQVLPDIRTRLDTHLDRRRQGRPKQLAPWQRDFKTTWADLSKTDEERRQSREEDAMKKKMSKAQRAELLEKIRDDFASEPGSYTSDLQNWTCSCPAFLASRFLVCKHLVREANAELAAQDIHKLSLRFFYSLRRSRTTPFYSIPGIHDDLPSPINDVSLAPRDPLEGPLTGYDDNADIDFAAGIQPIEDPSAESLEIALSGIAEIDGAGRTRFTPAYIATVKRSFDAISTELSNPATHYHSKHAEHVAKLLGPVIDLVRDTEDRKRRKTSQLTWKNNSANTFYGNV